MTGFDNLSCVTQVCGFCFRNSRELPKRVCKNNFTTTITITQQQKESEGLFQLKQQLETKTKTMNAMQCFTLSESLIWCKLNQHSLKAKQSGRQMS